MVETFLEHLLASDYRRLGSGVGRQCLKADLVLPVTAHPKAEIFAGAAILWSPGLLLSLQVLCIAIFVYTGRSSVTAAKVMVHVRQDRV